MRAALPLALAATWIASGGSFLGMRVVTQSLPPITVTAMRMLGASLILLAPFLWRLRDPANRPAWPEVRAAIVSGLLLLVAGQMMLVIGVSTTPAGTAAVFGSAAPLLVVVFAWAIFGDPIGGRRFAGIALGLAGLVLMGWTALSEGGLNPWGIGAILFSSVAWAAGSLYGEHSRLPGDPVVSIALQTFVAAVAISAIVPLSGEWTRVDFVSVPLLGWAAMAFVIATGLMLFSGFTWLNANTTGPLANTFTYVSPVLALGLGALLLGESLTWGRAVAAAVALVGVALIVSADRKSG